jgi:hypothetical protein
VLLEKEKTMSTKFDEVVAEFLLGNTPTLVLDAYKVVADSIKYPVGDKKNFSDQLDELVNQRREPGGEDTSPIELVRAAFGVSDFPIQTVQGGLEKLHRKLSGHSDDDRPRPIPPELTLSDPGKFSGKVAGFDPDEDYRRQFGDCAGACASAHYSWWVTVGGELFYYANQRGLAAGLECARTGFCPALPHSRRRFLFGCLASSPPPPFSPPPPLP